MTWDRTAVTAALPVAAVAIIAGTVSYSHIAALGLRTGQSPADAHLLPLAVDGLIAAGSVIILAGSALGWLAVAPGVAATLFANVESGLPHGPLAATVAAWPAIAFTVASFVLERWLKKQAGRGGQGDREVSTSAVNLIPPQGRDLTPEVDTRPCGHDLAGPPAEVVVQAWLHGRDCLGEAPSQRKLAATYGLHRTKVAALVGPLNGRPHDTGDRPPDS